MPNANINSDGIVVRIGVKSIIIKTNNPDNSDNARSYLVNDVGQGETILPVIDTTGFKINDFVIVGCQGGYVTEMVRVTNIVTDSQLIITPLSNAHSASEMVIASNFDMIEIWRGNYQEDSFIALALIPIDLQNLQGITSWYDPTGDEEKWYQVAFVNSFTTFRIFGEKFQGGVHSWATIQDVRTQIGFNESEMPDERIKYFLNEAFNKVVMDAFAFVRGDISNKETDPTTNEIRWYAHNRFFADTNKDNAVTLSDITVWEYDNWNDYDITNQVSVLNVRKGYVVLQEGYPTNQRSVKIDYNTAKRPHDEIRFYLREASVAYCVMKALQWKIFNMARGGVTSYGTDGVSVSKDINFMTTQIDSWKKMYDSYIFQIKPMVIRGTKIGGFDQPFAYPRFRGYF